MLDKIGSIQIDKTFPLEPKLNIYNKQGELIESLLVSVSEADNKFYQALNAWQKHLEKKK